MSPFAVRPWGTCAADQLIPHPPDRLAPPPDDRDCDCKREEISCSGSPAKLERDFAPVISLLLLSNQCEASHEAFGSVQMRLKSCSLVIVAFAASPVYTQRANIGITEHEVFAMACWRVLTLRDAPQPQAPCVWAESQLQPLLLLRNRPYGWCGNAGLHLQHPTSHAMPRGCYMVCPRQV